jgi:DNA helicase-2/ATP-dependent DNA helicase PcrA
MLTPSTAQKEFRDAEDMNLLLLAPAGCGKTEALAMRIVAILERRQLAPQRKILVVTFSNHARNNINDRLRTQISRSLMRERVTVMNFHGVAARIFQAHANVIDMNPKLKMPESDWVREQCRLRRLDYHAINAIETLLRKIKQQPLRDDEVEVQLKLSGNNMALEIETCRKFEDLLTYDDPLRLAELILENHDVAFLYQNHFECVFVDEFQDLTPQQLRLVKRLSPNKATFAGDLAQGIYSFAGANPIGVYSQIETGASQTFWLLESHRSSPAVLEMVNTLVPLTGGRPLTSMNPSAWPHGGFSGSADFPSLNAEADWIAGFCKFVLGRAPHQRVGVMSRITKRRNTIDSVLSHAGLPYYKWDEPLLDAETARIMKSAFSRLTMQDLESAGNQVEFLKEVVNLESIQERDTRKCLSEAVTWASSKLDAGLGIEQILSKIKSSGGISLLTEPGVHLLTGHIGKGQQFDWVVVLGMEEGGIPYFAAKTTEAREEEARVLSVMISRARHGVVLTRFTIAENSYGSPVSQRPSSFLAYLEPAVRCPNFQSINNWLPSADWDALSKG